MAIGFISSCERVQKQWNFIISILISAHTDIAWCSSVILWIDISDYFMCDERWVNISFSSGIGPLSTKNALSTCISNDSTFRTLVCSDSYRRIGQRNLHANEDQNKRRDKENYVDHACDTWQSVMSEQIWRYHPNHQHQSNRWHQYALEPTESISRSVSHTADKTKFESEKFRLKRLVSAASACLRFDSVEWPPSFNVSHSVWQLLSHHNGSVDIDKHNNTRKKIVEPKVSISK